MRKKNIAVGAVIAAAAGYVAGILTAPKSGKETRKDIHDTAIKAKTEAEKNLKKLYSDLNDLIEKSIKKATTVKKGAQKEFLDAIENAQAAKNKVSQMLSALHDDGDVDDKDLKKAMEEATKAKAHLQKFLKKETKTSKS